MLFYNQFIFFTVEDESNSSRESESTVSSGRGYIELLSGKLPALERNILKYRAFQIMLVIFLL